jgi:hypothetical protein
MDTNIEVRFVDGEVVIVFLGLECEADIDLVIRAWGILYQRGIRYWAPTSASAEFYYDARANCINRYDSQGYHDELVDVLKIARLRRELGEESSVE